MWVFFFSLSLYGEDLASAFAHFSERNHLRGKKKNCRLLATLLLTQTFEFALNKSLMCASSLLTLYLLVKSHAFPALSLRV